MLMGTLSPGNALPPSQNLHAQSPGSVLFTMSLLDRLSTPLLLMSEGRVVVWMNAICRRFVAESGELTLEGDRLRAAAESQRAALDAFLEGRRKRLPKRLEPDIFQLKRPSGEDGALLMRLTSSFSHRDASETAPRAPAATYSPENQVLGIIDPRSSTAGPNAA
jgi:hypothetical protein